MSKIPEQFTRTAMLIGQAPLSRLSQSKVAVFGAGGVGGSCIEALARGGIGTLDIYDDDTIAASNLNRQIVALHSTIGQSKAQAIARRVQDINPACNVTAIELFYLPENADTVDLTQYDYVVDAIDTVAAKLELAQRCFALQVNLISAMGSGNKLDPTAFRITDLSKTKSCPLARVMRKELKKRGIERLKVVYSPELPLTPLPCPPAEETDHTATRPSSNARRATPGSISFVPAAAGLVLASAVLRDLGGF